MPQKRFSFKHRSLITGFFLIFFAFSNNISAQDGKALFSANCASCHAVYKKLTGPALSGLEGRGPWSDRKQLYAWIHNPAGFMKTDKYTADLKVEYNGVLMTAFPAISEKEIDAIVTYINSVPNPDAGGAVVATADAASDSDNTLLYGILTLILAIVSFTLLQVNGSLRKMADDKEGTPALEPIPVWKNKSYITMAILALFLLGGYWTVDGAIGLGRMQNYQPEQPIFYSHKVHAGVNQISCLYCHGGAQAGKHSNIPSLNICMNCHMAINEYKGKEKLYTADGKEVNGTAEIQKLYKYAGFESGQTWNPEKAKPIEWVKIHNLPDHVYFNHSQHVVAGKVACQSCHGEIQKMDEVYQFSNLSMGWCINCHRESNVKFTENGFYSIYEKYHDAIKKGEMDSVSVEAIGGTECQKCHY